MRWLGIVISILFLLEPSVSHAELGGTNKAKPSYETLTGLCRNNAQVNLALVNGYLFYNSGYVWGRLERLDDFFFVFHTNTNASIGEDKIKTNVSLVFFTKYKDDAVLDFIHIGNGAKWFECDFSKDPRKIFEK